MRKTIEKIILTGFFLFISLVGYQMYSYTSDLEKVRLSALETWSAEDSDKKLIADKFIAACMKGSPVGMDEKPEKFISIYECAEEIGGDELEDLIRSSGNKIKAPAPLRWL